MTMCKVVYGNEGEFSTELTKAAALTKCLTESGKMIKLYMKFQEIFTRPKEILPDSVRHIS